MPYIGEIRLFGGNFAPLNWAFCNGQPLYIAEHDALFALIGTRYGGDGESTFNLPDLRGRVPLHMGPSTTGTRYQIAEMAGVEAATLTTQQIPVHSHAAVATTDVATESAPAGNVLAQSAVADLYVEDTATTALATSTVGPVGGSQPHDNMQPTICINYILSLYGVFPQQT